MSFGKGLNIQATVEKVCCHLQVKGPEELVCYDSLSNDPYLIVSNLATCIPVVNPLPDDKILDWSKLKQSADATFKFDENSRKFFK